MKNRSALVINPWVTDFKLYDEWMHPAGLYFLISLLIHNGWDVTYVDCLRLGFPVRRKRLGTGMFHAVEIPKPPVYANIPRIYKRYGTTDELFAGRLESVPTPSVIFIGSAMTYWLPGVIDTARMVRLRFPGVPVVIGGTGATLMPDALRQIEPPVTVFAGAVLQDCATLVEPVLAAKGWDRSMAPAFDCAGPMANGPVLATLGCPLRCDYCASLHLQPRFILRPSETVLDEIDACACRYGVTDFALYDDAFLCMPRRHLYRLLDRLSERPRRIRLHAPNGLHLRKFTDKTARRMKNAGFATLRFGYESSAAAWRSSTCAKASRRSAENSTAIALKAGYSGGQVGMYVMAGLEGQAPGDVIDELRFISSLGVQAKPVFYSPVPHTPLFERYARLFPQIKSDPYWHNDTFFVTRLEGWGWNAVEEIRVCARSLNGRLVAVRQ